MFSGLMSRWNIPLLEGERRLEKGLWNQDTNPMCSLSPMDILQPLTYLMHKHLGFLVSYGHARLPL